MGCQQVKAPTNRMNSSSYWDNYSDPLLDYNSSYYDDYSNYYPNNELNYSWYWGDPYITIGGTGSYNGSNFHVSKNLIIGSCAVVSGIILCCVGKCMINWWHGKRHVDEEVEMGELPGDQYYLYENMEGVLDEEAPNPGPKGFSYKVDK